MEIKKPLLIYDGDCEFCIFWINRWRFLAGDEIIYLPYQDLKGRFLDISEKEYQESVQFITSVGERYCGAEAVFQILAANPSLRWPLHIYRSFPYVSNATEAIYRIVSDNRSLFSKLTRYLVGSDIARPTMVLVRDFFLRGLGLIYAIAFASLGWQVLGLVGSEGILPAEKYLQSIDDQLGVLKYWQFPSVFWVTASDKVLQLVCWAGILISGLVALGFYSGFLFFWLWFLYISLMTVCRLFLGYQWDILLLETGFLSIFLAPKFWLPQRSNAEPSFIAVFLFRLLLFKLTFSTGVLKLTSNDPNWHSLKALNYHYFTQPLPTWIGWYAHHLSPEFQKFSVVCVFLLQLILPFFIFAPRRLRIFYFYISLIFQGLIALTGNYGFLNLLTVLLCLFLLDDIHLGNLFPREWVTQFSSKSYCSNLRGVRKLIWLSIMPVLIYLNFLQILFLFQNPKIVPRALLTPLIASQPFHLVNRYGLFSVMTTSRPEIIVEGSQDLETWKAYEFRWKIGDLKTPPGFVAPYQPRLDWQMWFAALGNYKNSMWLFNFLTRLAENSEDVTSLIKDNPFSEKPPKYIRAILYDYQFTTSSERKKTGAWWKRKILGPYSPLLKLPVQEPYS